MGMHMYFDIDQLYIGDGGDKTLGLRFGEKANGFAIIDRTEVDRPPISSPNWIDIRFIESELDSVSQHFFDRIFEDMKRVKREDNINPLSHLELNFGDGSKLWVHFDKYIDEDNVTLLKISVISDNSLRIDFIKKDNFNILKISENIDTIERTSSENQE